MTDENANALGAQALDVGAFLLVATLNGITLGDKNFGDGTHADAADADDMERTNVARHLHVNSFPRQMSGLTPIGVARPNLSQQVPKRNQRDGLRHPACPLF